MARVSILVVLIALLLSAAQAGAAPGPMRQALDTPTPTPAYQTSITLTSGAVVLVNKTWDFGELAIFLMLVVLTALYGLHWVYEFTHQARQ